MLTAGTKLDRDSARDFTIGDALGQTWNCVCGREHRTKLRHYVLEKGAAAKVPDLAAKLGKRHVFLVADEHTMAAGGQQVLEAFRNRPGIRISTFVYPDEELVPDNDALDRLREASRSARGADIWLAVGSGVLNDLVRFVSHEKGLPFMVYATAPSMDGYASGVSPLIIDDMKQTFTAQSPAAIVADPAVLAQAPAQMLQAGAGDTLGKFNSLHEWELARLLFDEYYCPFLAAWVARSRDAVARALPAIRRRDPAAVRLLFEALVQVGIAMDYSGNSRPASGAEHQVAHYWEMQLLMAGRRPALHGLTVGLALPYIVRLYADLAGRSPENGRQPDFDYARKMARVFDWEDWEKDTKSAYGPAAPGIIRLAKQEGLQDLRKRLARIDRIESVWPQIIALARQAPQPAALQQLYEAIGFPASPEALGISRELTESALIHARDLRDRYTILRLYEDLSLDTRRAMQTPQT